MRSIGIAALILALSGTAFAAGLSKRQSELFMKLDADQNGYIDISEARMDKDVAKAFAELDVNSDGKLTPDEFAAYTGK